MRTLALQFWIAGLLPAVGSFMLTEQSSTISLNWTAPFTLDISNVDPDITYYVGVVNSTSSVLSMCRINVTEFTYHLHPISGCDEYYTFTITPVNVVGNGANSSLNYTQLQCKICMHV